MSRTARPRLSFWRERVPLPSSASAIADGISSATVARNSRLPAGARRPVELLHVVLEAAEQERRAQHEQRVGDDRAGDRRLHQHVLARAQRGQRDDQLGQVSERRIEQPADRIAGLRRDGFGRMAEQCRQRHDRQHRQHEQQRVRLGHELAAANTTGTKASSQSNGLCRISLSRAFNVHSLKVKHGCLSPHASVATECRSNPPW